MRAINKAEHDFWCSLRKRCLLPESKIFGTEDELKAKLVDLRNGYLMIFAVVNSLWLIFIMLLTNQKVLFLLGSNPLGLAFLFVFGFVLIIQFLAMIVHRFAAWMHMIARAPYKFGQPYHTNWAFNPQEEDFIDRRIAQEGQERARRRTEHNVEVRVRKKQVRKLPVSEVETSFKAGDNPDINTPLLRESRKSTSYVT
ncbi:uncharacterized protein LOC112041925 [Lingula anatina]|uniref:Uncharacterized protein LOC112041925 n=1 Tax=Lingula anatina TaxID=7574 RepID=A0A2R2MMN8_LINAN|nr:uncharacterized protein LOC112041925 [Lingula anatina]|eukprot:XP_023931464.1 uncharacterized protein LOC112041925 [Lingula anatina]